MRRHCSSAPSLRRSASTRAGLPVGSGRWRASVRTTRCASSCAGSQPRPRRPGSTRAAPPAFRGWRSHERLPPLISPQTYMHVYCRLSCGCLGRVLARAPQPPAAPAASAPRGPREITLAAPRQPCAVLATVLVAPRPPRCKEEAPEAAREAAAAASAGGDPSCKDRDTSGSCALWARSGECVANPPYMQVSRRGWVEYRWVTLEPVGGYGALPSFGTHHT